MDQKLITTALGLTEDASARDILDTITRLRGLAGEDADDVGDTELIRRGQHENVSITREGAVVTLYVPIRSGTEEITELTIKRPTMKHLREMQESKSGTEIGRTRALLAKLTGRAEVEIDMLDSADGELCSVVAGFLRRPPQRTGSRS